MLLGQCCVCVVFCLPPSPLPPLPHLLSPCVCGRGRGDSSRVAHLPFIISSPADYRTPVSPLLAARLFSNLRWSLVLLNHVSKSTITRLVILLFLLKRVLSGFPFRELQHYSTSPPACLPACLPEPSPDYSWTPHLPITFTTPQNKPFSTSPTLSLVSASRFSQTQT